MSQPEFTLANPNPPAQPAPIGSSIANTGNPGVVKSSGTMIFTKFDKDHPSQLTSFRFLGASPETLEHVRNISGVSFTKASNTYYAPLSTTRSLPKRFNFTVQYLPGIQEAIESFDNRPDIEVTYSDTSKKVIVKFDRNRFFSYPIRGDFDSQMILHDGKSFAISVIEAWKLHKYHESFYPSMSIRYDKKVTEVIEQEINRRSEMEKFAKADSDETFPQLLSLTPRPYHTAAARFSIECFNRGYGPIVALDMGLGKTYVANLVARYLFENKTINKVLWVTKASLSLNLEAEIRKLTGEQAMRFQGLQPTQAQLMACLTNQFKHYIISYEIINRYVEDKDDNGNITSIQPWVTALNLMGFGLCVLDEAHNIKNMESARSLACRNLRIPRIMELTGTPVVNRPKELYPLLNVVYRERYDSEINFIKVHADGNKAKNPQKLKDELLPIVFRREKKDVEKDLPPIIRITQDVEIDKDSYNRYMKAMRDVFVTKTGQQYDIAGELARLTRCLQIVADAKVSATVDLAYEAYEETEKKVLIFSRFKSSMHEIAQSLNCDYIDGDVNEYERMRLVKDFQENPSTRYLVLSTAIGSEGLNLTAAHTVIFNDLMWTPKDHDQAEARAWGRLSDMHGCTAYYILADNTVDDLVWELLEEKRQLMRDIIDGVKTHISSDESIVKDMLNKLRYNSY